MLRRRDLRELPTVLVRMGVVGGAKLPLYFVASLYRVYEYMYILEKGGGGGGEGGIHNLVSVPAGFHPFSKPLLRLAVLVIIGAVLCLLVSSFIYSMV